MSRDCIKSCSIKKRLTSLNLVEKFENEDHHRMDLVEFSNCRKRLGHLNDIRNNRDYKVTNRFESYVC